MCNFRSHMRTRTLPDPGHFWSRDWRHFRGPTKADIAQLPVAHAQNILPVPVTDVTSGHVTSGRSPHGSPTNTNLFVSIYYLIAIVLHFRKVLSYQQGFFYIFIHLIFFSILLILLFLNEFINLYFPLLFDTFFTMFLWRLLPFILVWWVFVLLSIFRYSD